MIQGERNGSILNHSGRGAGPPGGRRGGGGGRGGGANSRSENCAQRYLWVDRSGDGDSHVPHLVTIGEGGKEGEKGGGENQKKGEGGREGGGRGRRGRGGRREREGGGQI